jgi:hypothetical protein
LQDDQKNRWNIQEIIQAKPLKHLFEIKTWGTKWKRVIDKTKEWAAWQWANANMDKKSLSIMRQIVNVFKNDVEDYNLALFTHAMDSFKERASLKKLITRHFFTSLLNNLSTKDLVTLGNLLSTKFMNLRRQLYATLSGQTWVPQELRNKALKQPVNRRMIVLATKPRNMYDIRKK